MNVRYRFVHVKCHHIRVFYSNAKMKTLIVLITICIIFFSEIALLKSHLKILNKKCAIIIFFMKEMFIEHVEDNTFFLLLLYFEIISVNDMWCHGGKNKYE